MRTEKCMFKGRNTFSKKRLNLEMFYLKKTTPQLQNSLNFQVLGD